MKRLPVLAVFIILLFPAALKADCVGVRGCTKEEQAAIDLVKHSKVFGGKDMTVGELLKRNDAAARGPGNTRDLPGWTVGERQGHGYTVFYNYKEDGKYRQAKWRVDVKRRTVRPVSDPARALSMKP